MHPLTYYVDESIKVIDGDEICALIAIKTIVPFTLISLIQQSIDKIISDPVLIQHNSINSKWVPHYCNDHPIEVHPLFLRYISQMPFEAYIVYGHKKSFSQTNEYDWYDNLMKILFTFRLAADKGRIDKVVYEQHDSKIGKRETHLKKLFQEMSVKDARRRRVETANLDIKSAGKDELPLCLPDYIGGSFMSYLCEPNQVQLGPKRREFELIAKKVRWIKNVDSGEIYTSKKPFYRD